MSLLIANKDFSTEGHLMHGKKPHLSQNSGNNEWYTPNYIIDAARKTMGSIDLDPASSAIANQTVMAKKYYHQRRRWIKATMVWKYMVEPALFKITHITIFFGCY